MKKAKIAIFASGAGTNAEAIIRHFESSSVVCVVIVLSNNPAAFVLDRANQHKIPSRVFNREQFELNEVVHWLHEAEVTHIVLAGFLWLIPTSLIKAFPDRIINIHPALLPKFSGKGMYGMKVHEAVRLSQERETGITIHLVDAQYDEGRILFQMKCTVDTRDDALTIAKKVHELEYDHFPRVIEQWISSADLSK